MNPVFNCTSEDGPVSEEIACPKIDECHISIFLFIIDNDFTLTAHSELYCDRQSSRDIIQSSLFVGSVLGLFIMNMVSDIKGRKFGFIVSLISAEVGVGCKNLSIK